MTCKNIYVGRYILCVGVPLKKTCWKNIMEHFILHFIVAIVQIFR